MVGFKEQRKSRRTLIGKPGRLSLAGLLMAGCIGMLSVWTSPGPTQLFLLALGGQIGLVAVLVRFWPREMAPKEEPVGHAGVRREKPR